MHGFENPCLIGKASRDGRLHRVLGRLDGFVLLMYLLAGMLIFSMCYRAVPKLGSRPHLGPASLEVKMKVGL